MSAVATMTVKEAEKVLAEQVERERLEEEAVRVRRAAERVVDEKARAANKEKRGAEIRSVLAVLAKAEAVLRELTPGQLQRVEYAAQVQTSIFQSGSLNRGEATQGGILDGIAKAVRCEQQQLEKLERV